MDTGRQPCLRGYRRASSSLWPPHPTSTQLDTSRVLLYHSI